MIDLHSHLLPDVDDGPETLADAVAMARLAARDGCSAIAATPHRRRDQWRDRSRAELERWLAELRAAVGDEIELLLGAEVRVDSDLLRDLDATPESELPTLGDSAAILLELEPRGVGPDPVELVHELRARGFVAVVAHPEITPAVRASPELAAALAEAGAWLQVTAMSLTGEFGREPKRAADELVEAGWARLVASDAHRPDWRPPGLSRARAAVERRWGAARARELFDENPRRLLASRRRPAALSGAPR